MIVTPVLNRGRPVAFRSYQEIQLKELAPLLQDCKVVSEAEHVAKGWNIVNTLRAIQFNNERLK